MEKFYYKVIETTTGNVLNPYFEKPSSLDEEENRDIRVPYSLLEKGVQLVRCYVRNWTDDKAQFVCDNFSDLLVDYFCPVHIQTEK